MSLTSSKLITPVVFVIFNRPSKTQKVLNAIRKAKPSKLYVISDGPRLNHPDDIYNVQANRAIINTVDWECSVIKDYSEINMGCKMRFYSGLCNVFNNEESAIILEDDCLPSQSFFPFCQELLNHYKDDERIMQISGTSLHWGNFKTADSYSFTRYGPIWGWATWRRAWININLELISSFNHEVLPKILNTLKSDLEKKFWASRYQEIISPTNNVNSWAYPWIFSLWLNNGLSIVPTKNLVQNLGFEEKSTHTSNINKSLVIKRKEIRHIKHPKIINIDPKLDKWYFETLSLYQEARKWKRFLNSTRIKLGSLKRKCWAFLKDK